MPIDRERSPGMKLLFVAMVAAVLTIPLMLVYALVYDRQDQSQTAQAAIAAGWGGPQVVSGPVVVVPFRTTQSQTEDVNGRSVTRTVEVEKLLYISPVENRATTAIDPQERQKSIYRSVLYEAKVAGTASFALPADLERFGVTRERLLWDRAELRMGASDARGLTEGGSLKVDGTPLALQPGKGPAASGGQGFFAFLPWSGEGTIAVDYAFGLRGSGSLSLVPRGGSTRWTVKSSWSAPSFGGAFLPAKPASGEQGFPAHYTIDKLALGQAPVMMEDPGPPQIDTGPGQPYASSVAMEAASSARNPASGGASEIIGAPARAVCHRP